MSFFDKIFGGSNEDSQPGFWNSLHSEEDLKKAVEESYSGKVVLFKHSTRCHISKTVLRNFENEVKNSSKNARFYFLDLLSNRALSNKIADDFGIVHQSPQMIVLENGAAVKDASHQAISLSLV